MRSVYTQQMRTEMRVVDNEKPLLCLTNFQQIWKDSTIF